MGRGLKLNSEPARAVRTQKKITCRKTQATRSYISQLGLGTLAVLNIYFNTIAVKASQLHSEHERGLIW